jgi:hypothetical protein
MYVCMYVCMYVKSHGRHVDVTDDRKLKSTKTKRRGLYINNSM